MNLESSSHSSSTRSAQDFSMEDLDFKPITSGLGFHHNKTTSEIKPAFVEKTIPAPSPKQPVKPVVKDMQVYQNDLSLFYNKAEIPKNDFTEELRSDVLPKAATSAQRILSYIVDLGLVTSVLAIVLTVMARMAEMDLVDMWSSFPNEMLPLTLTLFVGFYLMYFSIFEKTLSSTLGKSLFGIRVVDVNGRTPTLLQLIMRSFLMLMNFLSVGLFSYFNLQDKVSNTKVVHLR
jgi:uncharacterized RDD family membrane protein YckC